jgi:pentatricopeptide repeat protein
MVMIATRGNQGNRSISNEASRPDIARDSLERHFISMLGRVDEKSRFGNLEELWANARSAFTLLDEKTTVMPLKLYHLFIRAAYRMRNHNAAVEIWNDMVVNGVQPTVTHWTEMIHGAGSMKDLDAVENMWQRMLDAGVKPDAVAWTARIRSTMRCARTNRGLSLLEEWSREWVTAAETYLSAKGVKKDLVHMGDLPGVSKPTPQTLNTVLKGLIDKRQHKRIQQLMGWAASCGILPDEYTFNLLIGMHMQDGEVAEAMAILDQMPAQKIEPSVVTFTILIDGIYQSDAASLMTPDAQATIAEQVLEAMENRGTEANLVTYGALINGLLHHQNIDAAKKVLAHMHARGKAVPPQVHTVLMKYFFNHYNTESGSVKDLWANLNTADLKEDALFFNTMVQGFANAHEFDLTLRFLSKMARNGMDPSWTTLTVAVKALMDAGQRDRVQAIVDGAATAVARGGMDIGSGGQPGTAEWHREAFWRLVESLGLKPSKNVINGF